MQADKPTAHDAIRVAAETARLLSATVLDVPADAMSRMSREGVLERIIPGIYIGTRHPQHPLVEAAAWRLRHPHAVTCLHTAAAYFELTDAFAGGTWLYIPKGESPPRSTVVPVHVIQTASQYIDPTHDHKNGIVTAEVHSVIIRITDPNRTTLDLWRYPRRVSREHALEALRRRVQAKDFHLPAFARLGRRLGVWRKVEPIIQGIMLR